MTLDDDIAERLKELAHQRRQPFKQVVNDVLRAGLDQDAHGSEEPFRVTPHDCGFLPGVDTRRLNQLADELETESYVAEERDRV